MPRIRALKKKPVLLLRLNNVERGGEFNFLHELALYPLLLLLTDFITEFVIWGPSHSPSSHPTNLSSLPSPSISPIHPTSYLIKSYLHFILSSIFLIFVHPFSTFSPSNCTAKLRSFSGSIFHAAAFNSKYKAEQKQPLKYRTT